MITVKEKDAHILHGGKTAPGIVHSLKKILSLQCYQGQCPFCQLAT